MMDDCWAPQWADFTHSPQVPSDNYFDVEHEVHDPQLHIKSTVKKYIAFPGNIEIKTEQSINETKFDDSLEKEPPECTSTAYFIPHDSKEYMVADTKKEDQLSDDMKNLEINDRSSKIHQAWNISITDLTCGFKSSLTDNKVKRAMPERIKKNITKLEEKKNGVNKSSLKSLQTNNLKRNQLRTTATNDKIKSVEKLNADDCLENDHLEERLSYKVVSHAERQPGLFKTRRYSLNKSQTRVLTCQYRRQSFKKYRRCSNKFISLAEAVSKFQNGTPQRFRTLNRNLKPEALMKLKHSPLKLTLPVSPALRCKQRSRRNNVLSTQEREQLEMEELKRHQIKANPVPVNILKGPSALKKVTKKPATIAEEFHFTQPKKTRHTTGPFTNLQRNANDNEQKNTISATALANTSNIVDKDNACTESAVGSVKAKSSSFEARNKQYRMKKEENLKNLCVQETNKTKAQFHARPAPKFSKPKEPVKEQNAKKRTIVPCPFSFETRNKTQVKKKEELVKQMQEQDKKSRVFHANPAPSFKPVTVHGVAKENLRNKEKPSNLKELRTRQIRSCNDQENKQPNIMAKAITRTDTKKKDTKQNIANNKPEKKEMKSKVQHVAENKNEKQYTIQKKAISFELSTDKRARERSEFDEKIRKKEQELEMKKLEEEKNRLLKEKLERAQLRKMAEVKARPMPVFKPMVILKSTKPPTSPQSPALGIRKRAKSVS
ncbi:uncharacterized protein LOC143426924 [Xylocopa sonorina]|uniref:uncharacterized protein LOC143426924 n=1 Tax=Xylocopa sonorina TaxID=1818115 RepID=UPI00403B1EA6